ncbi:MAG: entericidin [bacterium]|nr:entericidin [bacterium]
MPSERSAPNRRLLALAFAALGFCAVALASCSTVEGMGEDLEYVGENMSEASRDAQD